MSRPNKHGVDKDGFIIEDGIESLINFIMKCICMSGRRTTRILK